MPLIRAFTHPRLSMSTDLADSVESALERLPYGKNQDHLEELVSELNVAVLNATETPRPIREAYDRVTALSLCISLVLADEQPYMEVPF